MRLRLLVFSACLFLSYCKGQKNKQSKKESEQIEIAGNDQLLLAFEMYQVQSEITEMSQSEITEQNKQLAELIGGNTQAATDLLYKSSQLTLEHCPKESPSLEKYLSEDLALKQSLLSNLGKNSEPDFAALLEKKFQKNRSLLDAVFYGSSDASNEFSKSVSGANPSSVLNYFEPFIIQTESYEGVSDEQLKQEAKTLASLVLKNASLLQEYQTYLEKSVKDTTQVLTALKNKQLPSLAFDAKVSFQGDLAFALNWYCQYASDTEVKYEGSFASASSNLSITKVKNQDWLVSAYENASTGRGAALFLSEAKVGLMRSISVKFSKKKLEKTPLEQSDGSVAKKVDPVEDVGVSTPKTTFQEPTKADSFIGSYLADASVQLNQLLSKSSIEPKDIPAGGIKLNSDYTIVGFIASGGKKHVFKVKKGDQIFALSMAKQSANTAEFNELLEFNLKRFDGAPGFLAYFGKLDPPEGAGTPPLFISELAEGGDLTRATASSKLASGETETGLTQVLKGRDASGQDVYEEQLSYSPLLHSKRINPNTEDEYLTLPTGLNTYTADELLSIQKQLIRSLEYLRRQGLVHFDIKPQNILINGSPPKVFLIDTDGVQTVNQAVNKQADYIKPGSTAVDPPIEVTEGYFLSAWNTNKKLNPETTMDHDSYALGVSLAQLVLGKSVDARPTPYLLVQQYGSEDMKKVLKNTISKIDRQTEEGKKKAEFLTKCIELMDGSVVSTAKRPASAIREISKSRLRKRID